MDLDSHQGLVRCGRCQQVFNASWNLIDQLPAKSGGAQPVAADDQLRDATTVPTPRAHPSPGVKPETRALGARSTQPVRVAQPEITDVSKTEVSRPKIAPPIEPGTGAKTPQRLDLPKELAPDKTRLPPPIKRSLSKPAPADDQSEQITIETPPMLWNFDEDEIVSTDDLSVNMETIRSASGGGSKQSTISGKTQQDARSGANIKVAQPSTKPSVSPERRRLSKTRTADDVKLVEIPQPKPVRNAVWVLGSVFALLLIVFQMREFYLDDLAQVSAVRPILTNACRYLACTVPPRSDLESIDLVGTSVNPHPEVPGALRVSVNLMNRATFEQAYPSLEITLTDKEGDVVGRRTYLPREYGQPGNIGLAPRVIKRVDLDLATPTERAVGYEIQLVAS